MRAGTRNRPLSAILQRAKGDFVNPLCTHPLEQCNLRRACASLRVNTRTLREKGMHASSHVHVRAKRASHDRVPRSPDAICSADTRARQLGRTCPRSDARAPTGVRFKRRSQTDIHRRSQDSVLPRNFLTKASELLTGQAWQSIDPTRRLIRRSCVTVTHSAPASIHAKKGPLLRFHAKPEGALFDTSGADVPCNEQ
eukprot:6193230-Pleurochrysis_carterae.AAC.1